MKIHLDVSIGYSKITIHQWLTPVHKEKRVKFCVEIYAVLEESNHLIECNWIINGGNASAMATLIIHKINGPQLKIKWEGSPLLTFKAEAKNTIN